MKKNLFGVFLFFFSILFFFKLAVYNASDVDDFVIKNYKYIFLPIGKNFSIKTYLYFKYIKINFIKLKFIDEIIQSFGFVVFSFPLILFIISIVFILKKKIKYLPIRIILFPLFIFVNCFLLANFFYFDYFFEFLPGGYLGYFLLQIINIFSFQYISVPMAIMADIILLYLIFFIKMKFITNKEKKKQIVDIKKSNKGSFFKIFFSIKLFFELIFKIFSFLFKSLIFKKKEQNSNKDVVLKFEQKEINNKKDIVNLNYKNIDLSYKIPPLELISYYNSKTKKDPEFVIKEKIEKLTQTLRDFGVKGEVVNWSQGPVVTLYEFLPEAGIRASRIIGLTDDIARVMMVDAVRIFLITGKDVIGIEISNETRCFVGFREILETDLFRETDVKIPMILGVDIFGQEVIADLSKMPHLLIAGTTGSGKSVGINCMILSLIYKLPPSQCRFIMIDPKMLEFSVYNDIPHLLMPVITDSEKAIIALKWAVKEMENRYAKMSERGVRNIEGYNESVDKNDKLPYLIIFIDEMADLMIIAGKEFEVLIQRLAQMARASGIHIITATQRPSVDVLTGVIKANFPTRISYYITSKIDSRTIIGEQGAERLLGKGDMLYVPNGGKMTRVHGPFVSDIEINKICSFLRENHSTNYIDFESIILNVKSQDVNEDNRNSTSKGDYEKAVEIVLAERKTSISYIQRKLRIGYNKAASFVEQMEEEGILSSADHTGKRRILIDEE